MVKKIVNYYRIKEWYSSKIPLAMAMLLYVCQNTAEVISKEQFVSHILFFFLFWTCFFAFNYLFNDYADLDKDKAAGKIKVIQSISPKITVLNLLLLFGISMTLCFIFFPNNLFVALIAFISYLLGMAYSAKGVRLKEKGAIGVIECSFAQRNMPVIMLLAMFDVDIVTFICWMCIVFSNGLRYILVHQLLDKANDEKVGIKTFVTQNKLPFKGLIVFFWLLEIMLIVVLFRNYIITKIGLILVSIYVLICVLNSIFIKKVLGESYMFSFANLPLEDLYNVFMPLILAVSYGLNNKYYWLIITAIVYLCIPLSQKFFMPLMCVWKIVTGNIKFTK